MTKNQKNLSQNCSLSLKQAASLSPVFFASAISGGRYLAPEHIRILDRELLDLASGRNKRLIINMPPRHGKSELISKYFPAWYLGNFPNKRVILSSYEASFAASWGAKTRDLLLDCGEEIFGISLKKDKRGAEHFEIANHEGAMYCVGAGGALTGKGADLLIVDDPIKNDLEANSKTYRDKVYEWFQSTAFTRLEPNGAIALIMTRWNEDDLCGRLIGSQKEKWRVVSMPAIAENDDLLGRELGEALWKERYDLDALLDISLTIGPYWFSALYQQSPSPIGGGIFKRDDFRYFSENDSAYILKGDEDKLLSKRDLSVFCALDLAMSTK